MDQLFDVIYLLGAQKKKQHNNEETKFLLDKKTKANKISTNPHE